MKLNPIKYENGVLIVLDQTKLPHTTSFNAYRDYESIAQAIEKMEVRGAPLIGITAAYGVLIGAIYFDGSKDQFKPYMLKVIKRLENTRPTAVNLHWALQRMKVRISSDPVSTVLRLEEEAENIYQEDCAINKAIGNHLLPLIQPNGAYLTHCNPGALATSEYGTATAPFYLAHEQGIPFKVYSDETRPRLQGALTAYELSKAGIDVTTVIDSTAATLLSQGVIRAVFVGCDRVARNGDVVNKIGTLPLAIVANYYNVPVYVAAPTPTFDLSVRCGDEVPIETRNKSEVTQIQDIPIAVSEIDVFNPAFDITPNHLIKGLATEYGIIEANEQSITQLFKEKRLL
ncbi:S-methyl-5-thioribose-1-phosphate isomerase [Macrococcus sp. DPC7161]|uniref:S-methyl-5-thioribose-1-phosphate isomerase n=1 Tax=Macrococcus sp. DPC7161 TaxID=2507060 RepID=UPI00100A9D75|nr:S-methyl-5-thioribose-1-phosphate isomerase [Macrococcus sp. DPC7161]RXK17269.1 S-methyl-5-thioribose-1-phosphate isomerase [Macrococcus sp. DPC7161]